MAKLSRAFATSMIVLALSGSAVHAQTKAQSGSEPRSRSRAPSTLQSECRVPLKTGRWQSNHGNPFWIRCVGIQVYWIGMNSAAGGLREGERWSQVGRGTVSGNRIDLVWADVPYGSMMTRGRIQLVIDSETALHVVRDDGLFDEPYLHWVANR